MIIVTGGAGFIGSNIVRALNERGRDDIWIVDDLGTGDKYKNLIGLRFEEYVHKDTFINLIMPDVEPFSDQIEVIFHEGACSDTMEYDVNFMVQENYEYSQALLNFCLDNEIDFIYASSAATYGDGRNGFTETDNCEGALNPYAFSKLLFDRFVRRNLRDNPYTENIKIVGLRYFNVYGAQELHKGRMASIVCQMYHQVKTTGKIKLFKGTDGYDDGEQRRDFIYVKDVAQVNLWCWENDIKSGIYNCGTGTATTFNALAQAVISALGTGKIEYIDFPQTLQGKYQSFTQADTRKLLRAGFDGNFTSISDAVGEYCKILSEGGYY